MIGVIMMSTFFLFVIVIVLFPLKPIIYQFAGKCSLEDRLAKAGGALEIGGYHRFLFLYHAQPPLH
ncbi:hypothetical protein D4R89_00620, partial [bacterium]